MKWEKLEEMLIKISNEEKFKAIPPEVKQIILKVAPLFIGIGELEAIKSVAEVVKDQSKTDKEKLAELTVFCLEEGINFMNNQKRMKEL